MARDSHGTFTVRTVEKKHTYFAASGFDIVHNENSPTFLDVFEDDDFEDGPQIARSFNMNHVIDFGWE